MKAAEHFGPKNPLLAITLYYLASTQQKQGRPTDAEPLFRRALDVFEARSGSDDREVAELHGQTLNDLAIIYAGEAGRASSAPSKHGQFEEAERLFQRALAIREKSDPGQVGRSLSNLTQLYADWGRWSEAAVAAERAVSFYERQGGPEDEEVVYQQDRLADIYVQQGRLGEAEPLIRHVVSRMQKTVGPNHPAVARRLESYAVGLRKAGREADAREGEAQARKIRDSVPTRP